MNRWRISFFGTMLIHRISSRSIFCCSTFVSVERRKIKVNSSRFFNSITGFDNRNEIHKGVNGGEKQIPPKNNFFIYYNDVYEVNLPPKHRFPMKKYRQVRERVQASIGQNVDRVFCELKESPLATTDDLTTTHCPAYVQRYISGQQTESEQKVVGFPWSKEGVARTISSVGGTVAATMDVCSALAMRKSQRKEGINEDSTTWGAHIAGGTHHACYDHGEGFCVFSDIAVAANVALKKYPHIINRILIIDLDVHQGNGNARLFAGNANVMTFSMHCRDNYFSPKEESDLDIELPAGCNDETYIQTLHHWLKRIFTESDPFDLIFFQAGVDILAEDRLGRMSVSREGIMKRNQLVFDFVHKHSLPLVITMGGGYPKKEWEPILQAHTDVYLSAFNFLKGSDS